MPLRLMTFAFGGLTLAVVCCAASPVAAQDAENTDPAAAAKRPSIERWEETGILTVIPPSPLAEETFSHTGPLVEVTEGLKDLQWTPNYLSTTNTLQAKAQKVILRRNIWGLEFAFKPLRMIEVDVPQPTGKMQRKLIWYLVYRVRNTGSGLNLVPEQDNFGHTIYGSEKGAEPSLRFFPHFVLSSHEYQKSYLDRFIPAAIKPIQERETPGVRLYSSVEMSKMPLPVEEGREAQGAWGVAMWEDVDPRIDFFSVYVRGLTNAYKFEDPPGAFKPGDPPGAGRKFAFKTLQLNFWRPGDTRQEHENEIRFGVPIEAKPEEQEKVLADYGLQERVDYLWVYR